MTQFVRPPVTSRVYRDDGGRVIHYGRRWGRDGPPHDAYSRTSHLDRYEPVHVVAQALIDYLARTYDAVVENGPSCIEVFLRPELELVPSPIAFLEAVTLSPQVLSCAPLTFGFTSFPGLSLRAGVLYDFHFPHCGCDACDVSIDYHLDKLEQSVFAVTRGNFTEWISRRSTTVNYELKSADGAGSGRTRLHGLSKHRIKAEKHRIKAAKDRLAKAPNGWTPWPLKSDNPNSLK
jgi:hypothetical protein